MAEVQAVWEIGLFLRVGLQAHSLSNSGTNGSIRTLGRRQLLADGTKADAISGQIMKYYHARLLAQYAEAQGLPLCPACLHRHSRRAAALVELKEFKNLIIDQPIRMCVVCDVHGLLSTSKKADAKSGTEAREGVSKASLLKFPLALAKQDQWRETTQFHTRRSDPAMLEKPVRSGLYSIPIRYECYGIGVDTLLWRPVVTDEAERIRRHQAVLQTLRASILTPSGANMASTHPHLTSLEGAIVLQYEAGLPAPGCSSLNDDFIAKLRLFASDTCRVLVFEDIGQFDQMMREVTQTTTPYLPLSMRAKI